MKPPWERSTRCNEDLEALQTDVMRFMAILGFCLVAIFSILQSPELQRARPAEMDPSPVQAKPLTQSGSASALAQVIERPEPGVQITAQVPLPTVAEEAAREGFTLEFASAESLQRLLLAGRAQLYVSRGEDFWRWEIDDSYRQVPAPESYYGMLKSTVPAHLRAGLPPALSGTAVQWGVSLDRAISRRIGDLVQQRQSGALLIAADGSVSFARSQ
jgi:hypothetical protein